MTSGKKKISTGKNKSIPTEGGAQPTGEAEFEIRYDRIQKFTGTKTQEQLAESLGIRQSSISDAKRRRRIPAEWYMTLSEKGANALYLKHGVGEPYMSETKDEAAATLTPFFLSRSPSQILLIELFSRALPKELAEKVAAYLYISSEKPPESLAEVLQKVLPGDLVEEVIAKLNLKSFFGKETEV